MTAAAQTRPLVLSVDEVRRRVAAAVEAGHDGMALAELGDAERGGFYTSLLDQAIRWMSQTGRPFTANDVRELIPLDCPSQGLPGARFNSAWKLGAIRPVPAATITGLIASTKKSTHGKGLTVWVGVRAEALA